MSTFTLSIEPTEGKSFIHGFHLGTIESVARECAVYHFHSRNTSPYPTDHNGRVMATRTVALIRDGKIFDVYYGGKWHSEYALEDLEDLEDFGNHPGD